MNFLHFSLAVLIAAVAVNQVPKLFKDEIEVPPVTGFVEPGWEQVKEVYRQLYRDGDDRGSSLGVYHKGKLVVDLRGGFADEAELWPWQENTVTRIMSVSKGLSAICLALLADRGVIEYDALITKYWPEFGVNGKEGITVEMLLSNQAGVPVITSKSFSVWDELNDVEKLGRLLAEEKPLWPPGQGIGYHIQTFGLYVDQLVRRVDPKHRSLPQFFKEEISEPFGIDIQFGLPDVEMYRMAKINLMDWKMKYYLLPYVMETAYYTYIAQGDPNVKIALAMDLRKFDQSIFQRRPDVNKLWSPSGMGYSNGRSLAKLFGIIANGGTHKGKTLMSEKMVQSQTKVIKSGLDKITRSQTSHGRGYTIYMSPKDTPMFGHPGLGGQMGYGDPAYKLGIGYTTNYLIHMSLKDYRFRNLEKAIYECAEKFQK